MTCLLSTISTLSMSPLILSDGVRLSQCPNRVQDVNFFPHISNIITCQEQTWRSWWPLGGKEGVKKVERETEKGWNQLRLVMTMMETMMTRMKVVVVGGCYLWELTWVNWVFSDSLRADLAEDHWWCLPFLQDKSLLLSMKSFKIYFRLQRREDNDKEMKRNRVEMN